MKNKRAATKDDKINRDLQARKERKAMRRALMQKIEHIVLSLDINWKKFHRLLEAADGCSHDRDYMECRYILGGIMGLDDNTVEACLLYFSEQGGHCDCEVSFNVDMTNPPPLWDMRCADCGHDYGEFYVVHDDIWLQANGAREGMLCIGCLERRMGRRLHAADFSDVPINDIDWNDRSLRLKDRLSKTPRRRITLRRA